MWRNTTRSFGAAIVFLHWLTAALVLAQFVLGWTATAWPLSPTKLDLFVWHKSVGMLILALVLLRLGWRWFDVTPKLPSAMPRWQRRAARGSHAALYALLIAMPLSGWVINSAANVPFKVFWLFPLPDIAPADKSLQTVFEGVHFVLFVLLSLLVLLHAAAALWHHYRLRDEVLKNMLRAGGDGG